MFCGIHIGEGRIPTNIVSLRLIFFFWVCFWVTIWVKLCVVKSCKSLLRVANASVFDSCAVTDCWVYFCCFINSVRIRLFCIISFWFNLCISATSSTMYLHFTHAHTHTFSPCGSLRHRVWNQFVHKQHLTYS